MASAQKTLQMQAQEILEKLMQNYKAQKVDDVFNKENKVQFSKENIERNSHLQVRRIELTILKRNIYNL